MDIAIVDGNVAVAAQWKLQMPGYVSYHCSVPSDVHHAAIQPAYAFDVEQNAVSMAYREGTVG